MTDEFDKYWKDRNNWKFGIFYNCLMDPRVIVPKRPKWMGRTLNFAHGEAYVVLFATLFVALIPIIIGAIFGITGSPAWLIAYFVLMIGVVVFYYSTELRVDKPDRRNEK